MYTSATSVTFPDPSLTASTITVTAAAAEKKDDKRKLLLAFALFVATGAYFMMDSENPSSEDVALVSSQDDSAAKAGNLEETPKQDTEAAAPAAPAAEQTTVQSTTIPTMEVPSTVAHQEQPAAVYQEPEIMLPYAALPNPAVVQLPNRNPRITDSEGDTYRARLKHPYVYQHYRTVMELASKRELGSQDILTKALEDTQYWTRMRAAIALADMGVAIDRHTMRNVIADARSDLQANFFKRFENGAVTAGVFHVGRAAISLMDPKGRLQVLKVLNRESTQERHLYVYTAQQDPSEKIQAWASLALQEMAIPRDDLARMQGHETAQAVSNEHSGATHNQQETR
jgi:hypothetical protein